MSAAALAWQELQAPAHWRALEFISDLHLHEADRATFEAWRDYLHDTPADAVFILGDLFEVWVGDDDAETPGFASACAAVLRATTHYSAMQAPAATTQFTAVGPPITGTSASKPPATPSTQSPP